MFSPTQYPQIIIASESQKKLLDIASLKLCVYVLTYKY
jgi:hypothetical protein